MKKVFLFLLVLLILALLSLRFKLALVHYFDQDEFAHLYRASMLSIGEVPYRDFGYGYSPLFIIFLEPLFLIFKERADVVLWARALNFVFFLANTLLVFLIGKKLFSSAVGLLAAFFWVFFPMTLTKTLEIRPDHLGILFWLLSLFLVIKAKKGSKSTWVLFFSGVFYSLSLITTPKMLFAYPGLLVFLLVGQKVNRRFLKNLFFFHLAIAGPGLILWLMLLAGGVFKEAFYSLIILPREVERAYGKLYFEPLFPFVHSDSIYGRPGRSLPWLANTLVSLLGILAILRAGFLISFRKNQPALCFLVASFFTFAGTIILVYSHSLIQYYIPLVLIFSWAAAEFLVSLARLLFQRSEILTLLTGLVIVAFLFFASAQLIGNHLRWTNQSDLELVRNALEISEPDDYFLDLVGKHLFRKSAYWICCDPVPDFRDFLSLPLPSVTESLQTTKTKFILPNHRLGLDRILRDYIGANYLPTKYEGILEVRQP